MNQDLTVMGNQFDEIIEIIDNARTRAMRAVNAELINMYWEIGAYISQKVEADGWGMGIVYVFLTVLIAVTKGSSTLVARFDHILPQDAPKKAPKKVVASDDDANVALALAVALG